MLKLRSFSAILLLLVSCDMVEYSPHQVFDRDSPKGINQENIKRLNLTGQKDKISIVFIGDSQRFYEEIESFVKKVNELQGIDFVIIAGDISDFGLLQELEWVHNRLKKLKVPYFTVVGNHDVTGNGEETFERFYGAINYSFTYSGYKFIFHNTNSREYKTKNVPDLIWLADELNDDSAEHFIGISHVAPYDGDFDKSKEIDYATLLASHNKFLLSLHGHQHRHSDGFPYEDGVRYMVAHHFEAKAFVTLTFEDRNITKEIIHY